ncbi:chemotaxis protein CheD [Donghicola sp. C2-DW-16]|uniref:Probable chemoreceptor glutamine deamidase CheD n=1 Tax=Donghicola mangrovi TaxID=2729614 RepID=A0ABX2PGA2_9RHOB|nr:chemotaxis protein CheD [Donghicola mangrovi]NVO28510.1 chemotaxis protein CheD [Donghicola mangrovi]
MSRTVPWPDGMECTLKTIVSGETFVSGKTNLVISTVLGSCVSVCLYDEAAGLGGANHYFLSSSQGQSASYGAVAMEHVINGLMRLGADKSRLRAKVFGGALMKEGLADIGKKNASFALEYLQAERLPIVAMDLGGFSARRLHFHPVTGKARVVRTEAVPEINHKIEQSSNRVELFN